MATPLPATRRDCSRGAPTSRRSTARPRRAPPAELLAERMYCEGLSSAGRHWREVLADLEQAAEARGIQVERLAETPYGCELRVTATLTQWQAIHGWLPADLPFDPRCLAASLRQRPGPWHGRAVRQIWEALWPRPVRGLAPMPA